MCAIILRFELPRKTHSLLISMHTSKFIVNIKYCKHYEYFMSFSNQHYYIMQKPCQNWTSQRSNFIRVVEKTERIRIEVASSRPVTYRHCRQPKLPNFLNSSSRLLGGGALMPALLLRLPASVCRRYRTEHTVSGIVMDCAVRNTTKHHRNTTSWRLMRQASNNNNCRKNATEQIKISHLLWLERRPSA